MQKVFLQNNQICSLTRILSYSVGGVGVNGKPAVTKAVKSSSLAAVNTKAAKSTLNTNRAPLKSLNQQNGARKATGNIFR